MRRRPIKCETIVFFVIYPSRLIVGVSSFAAVFPSITNLESSGKLFADKANRNGWTCKEMAFFVNALYDNSINFEIPIHLSLISSTVENMLKHVVEGSPENCW